LSPLWNGFFKEEGEPDATMRAIMGAGRLFSLWHHPFITDGGEQEKAKGEPTAENLKRKTKKEE
jgi:hypothetical protein